MTPVTYSTSKAQSSNRGGRPGQSPTPINTKAIRKYLKYDPKSASGLTWLVNRTGGIKAGDRAGRLNRNGYWQVHVLGKSLLCHRVIWALKYGLRTSQFVDHKDGDRSNNRIRNLRIATASQNHQNLKVAKNNTTGVTGVYATKATGRYFAYRKVRGIQYRLGTFSTIAEASSALDAFDKQIGNTRRRKQRVKRKP
jgi:hypothetical protein